MQYDSIRKIPVSQHAQVAELRGMGWTLERIAQLFGVTRQRIWQILKEPK